MTIKIDVSADVSGIQSELKKVQDTVNKINSSMSSGEVGLNVKDAKNDLAELEESAKKLVESLDQAKNAGKDLSGVDLGTVSNALSEAADAAETLDKVLEAVGQSSGMSQTVKNAKSTADHIKRAADAHKILTQEGIKLTRSQAEAAKSSFDQWRKSGARGTSRIKDVEFDDWVKGGWRNYSMNEGDARRHRTEVLRSVGVNSPTEAGSDSANRSSAGRYAALAGAAGGFVGNMGQGGMYGSIGGMAGAGIGAGAGMLLGGPVGAVVGAFASKALGGLGSGIDNQMGNIGSEGALYTDLRHSLGATSVDFDMLRGSVRHFSDGLGLAYNESAKLAKEFAHTANLNADNGMSVGGEVKSAVGFGRGFGVSPEQSVSFMASMRQMGVTQNEQGNRKLALQIAESVKNGGTSAKMDEVLASLQSYVQSATRQSLTSADAGAYASFMSSLTGLSMNGIKGDPNSAASAMGSADAAMRQGGAFGDASKNFSLALWQRNLPGFTALDQDFMNEQGAFGNFDKAFGRNSPAYKMAEERGDKGKMAQYDDWASQNKGKSVLSMQMRMLEEQFGGNTDELRKSIQSHFGVGAGQASALYQAYKSDKGLGNLEKTLKDAGVDISGMNTKQISTLAELSTGGRDKISDQAKKLTSIKGVNALSKEEKTELDKSRNGGDEEFKATVLRLSAKHDALGDTGDEQRKLQADMNNAMQELATKLVPLTLAIKDGIVELVRYFAGDSDYVKQMDRDKRTEQAQKSLDDAETPEQKQKMAASMVADAAIHKDKFNDSFIEKLKGNPDDLPAVAENQGYSKSGQGSIKDGAAPLAKNQKEFIEKTKDAAERAAEKINKDTGSSISASDIQAQWGLETGWGKKVLSGTNNLGNIKAGGAYKGPRKSFKVKEYDKRGNPFYEDQDFRVYNSLESSADDYADLISKRYLKGNPAANSAEFAARLKKGGYATDPTYESKLTSTSKRLAAKSLLNEDEAKIKSADKVVSPDNLVKGEQDKPKPTLKEIAAQNVEKEQRESKTEQKKDSVQNAENEQETKLAPKEIAAQNVGKEQEDSKVSSKVNGLPNVNNGDDDSKVPTEAVKQSQQAAMNHKVSYTGEFILRDESGRQRAEPIIKTGFSSPVPAGINA